jgi:dihydropyrimidine dehydrogenase (NAD+) subunit PreT
MERAPGFAYLLRLFPSRTTRASTRRSRRSLEANRCLYCADAPCVKACPTHIEIPQFIRKIATGNLKGSARTIFDANILGMSCARVCPVEVLCVGDCVYNEQGVPPIQIGKLQRFATDHAFEAGWRFFEAGPDSGKTRRADRRRPREPGRGPRAAPPRPPLHDLREAPAIGGLNTTGVAPYKMKADRASRRSTGCSASAASR